MVTQTQKIKKRWRDRKRKREGELATGVEKPWDNKNITKTSDNLMNIKQNVRTEKQKESDKRSGGNKHGDTGRGRVDSGCTGRKPFSVRMFSGAFRMAGGAVWVKTHFNVIVPLSAPHSRHLQRGVS